MSRDKSTADSNNSMNVHEAHKVLSKLISGVSNISKPPVCFRSFVTLPSVPDTRRNQIRQRTFLLHDIQGIPEELFNYQITINVMTEKSWFKASVLLDKIGVDANEQSTRLEKLQHQKKKDGGCCLARAKSPDADKQSIQRQMHLKHVVKRSKLFDSNNKPGVWMLCLVEYEGDVKCCDRLMRPGSQESVWFVKDNFVLDPANIPKSSRYVLFNMFFRTFDQLRIQIITPTFMQSNAFGGTFVLKICSDLRFPQGIKPEEVCSSQIFAHSQLPWMFWSVQIFPKGVGANQWEWISVFIRLERMEPYAGFSEYVRVSFNMRVVGGGYFRELRSCFIFPYTFWFTEGTRYGVDKLVRVADCKERYLRLQVRIKVHLNNKQATSSTVQSNGLLCNMIQREREYAAVIHPSTITG